MDLAEVECEFAMECFLDEAEEAERLVLPFKMFLLFSYRRFSSSFSFLFLSLIFLSSS